MEIIPIKPGCVFSDTCGKSLEDAPGSIAAAREISRQLGVPASAIQTQSQLKQAFTAQIEHSKTDPEALVALGTIMADLIAAKLDGRTDLASLSVLRAVSKANSFQPVSAGEIDQMQRLVEMQSKRNSVE